MKLLVYSDLHLEFSDFATPEAGYDVVILAGDIHLDDRGVQWAKRKFADVPVIYICGNHEFYHADIVDVHNRIRSEVDGTNIHFCENETVYINDTRFVCATLWSDFRIKGNRELAMLQAGMWMNDYRLIKFGEVTLTPQDTARFHQESLMFLENELKTSTESTQKTVVVTHHAPSGQSLRYERVDDELSPAYASELATLMLDTAPQLWIHGHTHESVDYQIGETRVLSNPRGYSRTANGHGNPNFQPICIIDM